MKIRFTSHAEEKFSILAAHGVIVTKAQVIRTVRQPNRLDSVSRAPLIIAQGDFDERRILRVV